MINLALKNAKNILEVKMFTNDIILFSNISLKQKLFFSLREICEDISQEENDLLRNVKSLFTKRAKMLKTRA